MTPPALSRQIEEAARLLSDPARAAAATPLSRILCWSVLKTARGQHLHQARLQDLASGRLVQGAIAAPLHPAPVIPAAEARP